MPHEPQNRANHYDAVILGGGIGGLATAAQLAHAGRKVLLVERHSAVGGYAHSFEVGGYSFCHQVQYLMGCEPGGPVPRFLDRIGAGDVAFNFMDPEGYDVVLTPKLRFEIPSTLVAFEQRLVERFPAHARGIREYFAVLDRLFREGKAYEKILNWRHIAKAPLKHAGVIRYIRKTVDQVFDQGKFPEELRVILAGQAGNLAKSPRDASFIMHAGMQTAYSLSAAYPRKGMGDFIARIRGVVDSAPGCRVLTATEVTGLVRDGDRITAVETSAGRFTAHHVVSNLDPQRTFDLMAPRRVRRVRSYDYSDAVFSLYLGLEGLDPARLGFGKRNFWFHSHHDLAREFDDMTVRHRYDEPWVFISTPSLLADPGAIAPKGGFSLVALTFVDYAHWKHLEQRADGSYDLAVKHLKNVFFGVLEKHFSPEIRRHVKVEHVESPREVEAKLAPPRCAVYGAELTPASYSLHRVSHRSGLANLDFVGATSCYPGIMPIIVGAMELADRLLAGQPAQRKDGSKKAVNARIAS